MNEVLEICNIAILNFIRRRKREVFDLVLSLLQLFVLCTIKLGVGQLSPLAPTQNSLWHVHLN